jgi:hypothetical protein
MRSRSHQDIRLVRAGSDSGKARDTMPGAASPSVPRPTLEGWRGISSARLAIEREAMADEPRIQGLAAAAGYLCAAHDDLLAAGYKGWSAELKELIDILGLELEWLQADVKIPEARS